MPVNLRLPLLYDIKQYDDQRQSDNKGKKDDDPFEDQTLYVSESNFCFHALSYL
jgi:hypothetical protein